jgi:dynein heavy chain, axonemal
MLLDKLKQVTKNLKDVIARRVVQQNEEIYANVLQILHKLREQPKDIEELTELKEYMVQVEQDLGKIQEDIDACSKVYDILEDFRYSLSSEDINKRWVVFKGPKDILDTIAQRNEILSRDAKQQLAQMKIQQEEFKDNIDNIEKIIGGFHQYKNLSMHADVSKMARNIND